MLLGDTCGKGVTLLDASLIEEEIILTDSSEEKMASLLLCEESLLECAVLGKVGVHHCISGSRDCDVR